MRARGLQSTELYADVLDALFNAYIPVSSAPHTFVTQVQAHNAYVLTYPASLGFRAIDRYRRAARLWLDTVTPRREAGMGEPSVRLLPEAVAVCHNHFDSLKPEKAGEEIARVVVFDFGAGTLDVAAIDFRFQAESGKVGDVRERQQHASASMPLGGNALDAAIAEDVKAEAKRRAGGVSLDSDALLRLIDRAKRGLRTPRAFDVDGEPLHVTVPTPQGPLSFEVAGAASQPRTDAYLAALRDVVAAPLFAMLTEARQGQAAPPIKAIVISGRAALFWPVARAIRDGAPPALRPLLRWATKPADGAPGDYVSDDENEEMKTVVARGAIAWAQRNHEAGNGHVQRPPLARDIRANVALVEGTWKGDGWARIERIHACAPSLLTRLDGGDLFAVLRPPGDVVALNALAGDTRLMTLCLRPLRAEPDARARQLMDALALGSQCDAQKLCIATQAASVAVESAVDAAGELRLRVSSPGKTREFFVSSTFCA